LEAFEIHESAGLPSTEGYGYELIELAQGPYLARIDKTIFAIRIASILATRHRPPELQVSFSAKADTTGNRTLESVYQEKLSQRLAYLNQIFSLDAVLLNLGATEGTSVPPDFRLSFCDCLRSA
jgi:hypothetical protein